MRFPRRVIFRQVDERSPTHTKTLAVSAVPVAEWLEQQTQELIVANPWQRGRESVLF